MIGTAENERRGLRSGLNERTHQRPAATPGTPRTREELIAILTVLEELAVNPPQTRNQVAAVCIPPGARLTLHGIPENHQQRLGVGSTEEVTFTQITAAANSSRDAVRFSNGRAVRLQELVPGQRVRVRDLSLATSSVAEERLAY